MKVLMKEDEEDGAWETGKRTSSYTTTMVVAPSKPHIVVLQVSGGCFGYRTMHKADMAEPPQWFSCVSICSIDRGSLPSFRVCQ